MLGAGEGCRAVPRGGCLAIVAFAGFACAGAQGGEAQLVRAQGQPNRQPAMHGIAIEGARPGRDTVDAGADCVSGYLETAALYRSGGLAAHSGTARGAIAACMAAGDIARADRTRAIEASLAVDQGRADEAIAALGERRAEIAGADDPLLTAAVDATLARAWFARGDMVRARRFAESAVRSGTGAATGPPGVDAFELLYRIERRANDAPAAQAWLERYVAAEKSWRAEAAARALAPVAARRDSGDRAIPSPEADARSQMLRLDAEVRAKSAETERLYALLLLLLLSFFILWAIRTKRSQRRFQTLARRDGLTGIVNRQHFMEEARALLRHGAKTAREISVILIDLDHFKRVNDTRGHAAGDAVLRRTVAMCQLHMRSGDLFGRLGGEEFGVLLPDCGAETAQARAEELRRAIAGLAAIDGGPFVSASLGVTSTRRSGYDLQQMLVDSDRALYRAKRAGRNRVQAFTGTAQLASA